MAYITELFNHYGYIVLYIALTLELIALPTPGETLMTYCGFLVFEGKLNFFLSVLTASSGVITGITISYFVGRKLGKTFFTKYGSYIHFGPDKMDKTSEWFNKYGNGLLVIAYFLPGIRHVTGYFSGIAKIPFRKFAINAYAGACLWTLTFIFLGRTLGTKWEKFHGPIKKYLIIGGIITAFILICIYIYKNHRAQIISFVNNTIENMVNNKTLGRVKFILFISAQAIIAFAILIAGLIKNFWGREFVRFDRIILYLTDLIFPQNFYGLMKIFGSLTSSVILAAVTVLMALWIYKKGKNRILESIFLLSTVLGGEIFEELLRFIFHRFGSLELSLHRHAQYSFPSEQAFTSVVIYVFAAYLIYHHVKRKGFGIAAIFTALVICFLSGLSPIFFRLQYPSYILAGYAFGDIWLSINIILLEVFRILLSKPCIKNNR